MKTCRKCKAEKEPGAFNRYKNAPDGLQYWCRECFGENHRKRHRDPSIVRKPWYTGTEEQRAIARAKREIERNADREAYRAKQRLARTKNPERYRHQEKSRRALKKAGGGWVSQAQWQKIKELHGFKCYYCGIATELTQDHYLPLSRGGLHSPENIVPACKTCNSKKTYLTSQEYYERMCGGERKGFSKSTSQRNKQEGRTLI